MKQLHYTLRPCFRIAGILSLLAFVSSGRALAQIITNPPIPVVTIVATDPIASVSGDTGTFTLYRYGDTNASLVVYCSIGGTASNGVDYAVISNLITIPAGVRSNTITITPINHGQTNVQTVDLQLGGSPLMIPVNYTIGYPSNATVFIEGNGVTNLPPLVKMIYPMSGATFYTPTNIVLAAKAVDLDGSVTHVEFFAGTNDLGPGMMVVLDPPGVNGVTGPVWILNWTSVPVGSYSLTAVATDNGGASTTSDPVSITVLPGPPLTNLPPVVSIVTPTNGQVFYSGVVCPPCLTNNPPCLLPCYVVQANIPICAYASDPDGYVTTVEFFANGNSLGVRTNCVPCANPVNPFCLLWSNAPPGNYVLTAVATDNGGASTVSPPVNISIVTPPPPTNRPPVVRITSPPDGAIFRAPVDIPIFAYAFDPEGFVVSVEFFDGTNDLGPGHVVPCAVPTAICSNCPPPVCPYLFVWTNAPLGMHPLTAIATDNAGLSTVSSPVNITVLPPPPPATNRPPIVTIVATDPLAIEGTNCWVWPGVTNTTPTWSNWPVAISACRFFTNCGPKNAIFTVRRFGDTNNTLTVPYVIGGTATNSVDYIPLPGIVTIPAGERAAMITVVPIDDGPPDITSTVILKLLPSTNTPQDYLVGFPGRAAALILDGPFPWPATGMLPGPCFHLSASGPNGAWFRIEYSTDLLNWTPVCINQVVNGTIEFVDPDTQTTGSRFYRAVPVLNAPLQ